MMLHASAASEVEVPSMLQHPEGGGIRRFSWEQPASVRILAAGQAAPGHL